MFNKVPTPTATKRVSIQWDNETPEERTSTLVLTAPSGIFVDLRILVDDIPTASHAHTLKSASAIDWAFAGVATHQSGPSSAGLTQSTWKHWVDSRTLYALSVHDAGVSSPMPTGDTRERGEMKDASGVPRSYEEVWRDVRVEPACAAVYIRLRDGTETAARGSSVGLVDIKPEDVCGMLVLVGGWCQGILRDSKGFTAERWLFESTGDKDTPGSWVPVFRSGLGDIPCVRACTAPHTSRLGTLELSTSDGSWICVELYEGTSTPSARAEEWGH